MLQKNILVFLLGLTVACDERFILFGQCKRRYTRNDESRSKIYDVFTATTKEHQPASETKKNTLDGKSPFLHNKLLAFGKNKALISIDLKKKINRTDQRRNSSETPLSDNLSSSMQDIHPDIFDYINNSNIKENYTYSVEIPEKIVPGNYSLFSTNVANSAINFMWDSHQNLNHSLVVANLQLFFTLYPILSKQFDCNTYISIDRNSELENCIDKAFSAYSQYKNLLLNTQSKMLNFVSELNPKKNRQTDKNNSVMSTLNSTIASITAMKKKKKYVKIAEKWSEEKNEPLLDVLQDKVIPHEEEYIKTLQSKKKYSFNKKENLSSNPIFFQTMFHIIHNSGIKKHILPELSQNSILGPQTTNITFRELRNPWKRETTKPMKMHKIVKPVLHNDNKRILVSLTFNINHVRKNAKDQSSEFNKESSRDKTKGNTMSMVTFIFLKNKRQSDKPIFMGKSQLLIENLGILIEMNNWKRKRKMILKMIHIRESKKNSDPKLMKLKRIKQFFQRESTLCTLNQCASPKLFSSIILSGNKDARSFHAKRISQNVHIFKLTLKLGEQDNSTNIGLEQNAILLDNGLLLKKKHVRIGGKSTTQRLAYTHFDELYSKVANDIKNPYQYENVNRNILDTREISAITETREDMPWNRHIQILNWGSSPFPRKSGPSNFDDVVLKYHKEILQIISNKYAINNKWTLTIHNVRVLTSVKKRKMSSAESISSVPENYVFKVKKTRKKRLKRELRNDNESMYYRKELSGKQINYFKELSRILKEVKDLSQHNDTRGGTDNSGRKFSSIQNIQKLFTTKKMSNGENPEMEQNSKTKMKHLVPYYVAKKDNYLENKSLDIKNDVQNSSDVIQNIEVSFPSKKLNKAEITLKENSRVDELNTEIFEPHHSETKPDFKLSVQFTEKNAHQTKSYPVSNILFSTQRHTNLENRLQNGTGKFSIKYELQKAKNKNFKNDSKYSGNSTESMNIGAATESMNIGAATESMNIGAATESMNIGAATESMNIGAATESMNIGAATESMNDPLLIKRQKKEKGLIRDQSILQSKDKKISTKTFDSLYKLKMDKHIKPNLMDIVKKIPDYKRNNASINVHIVMIPKGFLNRLTSGLIANAAIFAVIFFFFILAVVFLLYRESKFCGILEHLVERIASKSDTAEELLPLKSSSAIINYPKYYAKESQVINSNEQEDSISSPNFPTKEVPNSRQFQTPGVTTNVNDVCKSGIAEKLSSVQMKIISDSSDEDDIERRSAFVLGFVRISVAFGPLCFLDIEISLVSIPYFKEENISSSSFFLFS
uniref:Uncharacterized protein LOC117346033 isoform X2 n=1 Tax=Geotrypetes seraphini TaxID=260995 RepID=A0A6P8NQ60_GEOSA|nr:uncharacterized protein LOC117346033 isoform X2 [Geotrypetes seraphini]